MKKYLNYYKDTKYMICILEDKLKNILDKCN